MASPRASTSIIVVPGAHHNPEHLQQVSDIVRKDGYTIETVRPLSPGDGISPGGMEGNLKQIHQVVKKHIDQGQDVILVVHSASGATGPAAIEGLVKTDNQPGVKHILAIAAILTKPGETMAEVLKGRTALWQSYTDDSIGLYPFDHPGEAPTKPGRVDVSPITVLYNDMTEAQKREAYDFMTPIYPDTFSEKTEYSAWQHIPMTYVITDKDLALFPEVQQELVDRTGIDANVLHWNSSHTPFASMPDTVAKLMEELADAPFKP